MFVTSEHVNWWDNYYAILFWLVAVSLGLGCFRPSNGPPKTAWKILAFSWAFCGNLIWLAAAYLQNQTPAFYLGLLIGIALLIAVRLSVRLNPPGIMTVNSTLLLLITLPIANLAVRQMPSAGKSSLSGNEYSRASAKKDPAQFARWWGQYLEQWNIMGQEIFIADPEHFLPFRLKPNGQGHLFQSLIKINSRGMRNREISADKGAAYRIVVLGESTTFGCTLKPEDRPWPEVLESMIQERMKPGRPVEVINAGVPAYDLRHNLHRCAGEILPLKPDMIISYHGYNGFKLLDKCYPRSQSSAPPAFKPRPSSLLAQAEYRWKMTRYRWNEASKTLYDSPVFGNPMKTDYALAYEALVDLAQTNRIQLVLADFSMAVNRRSDKDSVEFFRPGFPLVRWEIIANVIHTMIVKKTVRKHPEVCFVETHADLDGHDEMFIDLVHKTQAGRQQLAENMFTGIRSVLETDLRRVSETH